MDNGYEPVLDDLAPEQKRTYWDAAFGLQAVDGLKPTEYMQGLADEHVAGRKTYYQVQDEVERHYEGAKLSDEKEADEVSKAIYEILADGAFGVDVVMLKSYHRRLFSGLDEEIFHPGEFRTVNITKREPILDGDSVQYRDYRTLEETLKYDFDEEQEQNYTAMNDAEKVARLAEFTARIWQVHPFMEGNTRTTAVFIQKYLRNMGFAVDNEYFKENSLRFRNALVRANYTNTQKNISADAGELRDFFAKLVGEEGLEPSRP